MSAYSVSTASHESRKNRSRIRIKLASGLLIAASALASKGVAAEYKATPSNYVSRMTRLKAGDTLSLAAGTYPGLKITGLRGSSAGWIVIAGPPSGAPAVIVGSACCNTVEIVNSSFVSIENLTIDSKGIEGTFGISAKDGLSNLTHDIRIQNNRFIGQGASQQTVAISSKTPTWGWIIRRNTISGAGTGIYLGDSNGTQPFVAGVVENNFIENTIGYDMEIKWQRRRPSVAGMPVSPASTIIRNNVFAKDGRPSPDGDRPNVLVGGFPETGAGADDLYEMYGNLFFNNPREALLQASGRVSVHDNIFVGGEYTAIALQAQDLPLKLAHVYNNTIYTEHQGILFGSAATLEDAVVGNLIFAPVPMSGPVKHAVGNVGDTLAHAGEYVSAPSFDLATMDFYPQVQKCVGTPLDLQQFAAETDYALDFNGAPKDALKQGIAFRGAYAGEGKNPGWKLQSAPKNTAGTVLPASTLEITPSNAKRGDSGSFLIVLHAPKGTGIVGMQWELSVEADLTIAPADIVIGSAAAAAAKNLTCFPAAASAGRPAGERCLLAGGKNKILDGPIVIVRYSVKRKASTGQSAVHIGKAVAVTADLKTVNLGQATGILTIQ